MASTCGENEVNEAGNGEPSKAPTVSDGNKTKAEEFKEIANEFFKSNDRDVCILSCLECLHLLTFSFKLAGCLSNFFFLH